MARLDEPLHDFADKAIRERLKHPQNLRDFLGAVVPDLAARFDCDRVEWLERSFLLEDWRGRESDLLFRIPFRTGDGLQTVLVCVLIEHQSEPDPRMPLRMLLYAVLFWEREWKAWEDDHAAGASLRLTPVLPIVFHTGPRRWGSNRTLAELIGGPEELRGFIPEWHVLFWDLAERTPEALLNAVGEFIQALAVVRVDDEARETFRNASAEALARWGPLSSTDRMRWLDLVNFILSWGYHRRPRSEWPDLVAIAVASQAEFARQEEVRAMIQPIVKSYAQEVREEIEQEIGQDMLAQGETRGKLLTCRDNLLMLLQERFGTLPGGVVQQIEAASDLERLKAALRQVLRLNSLDELQL